MPRRLLLALLILVAAPLVLLGWVTAKAMADSEERAKRQYTALLDSRLAEIDRVVARQFDDYAVQLTNAMSRQAPIRQLQLLRRENPIVRQGIFVSADGQLLYPSKPSSDDPDAVALYASLPGMVSSRPDIGNAAGYVNQLPKVPSIIQRVMDSKVNATRRGTNRSTRPTMPAPQSQQSQANISQQSLSPPNLPPQILQQANTGSAIAPNTPFTTNLPKGNIPVAPTKHQWQVWYMDQGMQLILWLPTTDGSAVGILLERPRWTSDLIGLLPESNPRETDKQQSIAGITSLVDESQSTVYRWGNGGELPNQPTTSIDASGPLNSWQWQFHSTAPLIASASSVPLIASLSGIGILLLALGGYVFTSVQRQMRSARNRVSFAGQVSHELRTPLTNIRLYAELAEGDLEKMPDTDQRDTLRKRLGVIDAESKRLGRLVSGVLEMIRDGKSQRGPKLRSENPDQLIEETIGHFAPSLQRLGFDVQRDFNANCNVMLDADIFEMVLVNLISNVEKYAADGLYLGIASRVVDHPGRTDLGGRDLVVTVTDHGPGISKRNAESIFRPFTRLDNSISAPSGTGIGLTIAKNAVNRHGGSLSLLHFEGGAKFEMRIPVERCTQSVAAL